MTCNAGRDRGQLIRKALKKPSIGAMTVPAEGFFAFTVVLVIDEKRLQQLKELRETVLF